MYNNINLLPPKMRKKRRKRIKFDNPTYGLILLIVVLLAVFVVRGQMLQTVSNLDSEIDIFQNNINKIMPQIDALNAPSKEHSNLESSLHKLRDLSDGGLPWATILDQISYSTHPNVTITRIENNENTIILQAETHTLRDMATMTKSFEENPYFNEVTIESYNYKPSSITERAEKGRNPAMKFTLTFELMRREGR